MVDHETLLVGYKEHRGEPRHPEGEPVRELEVFTVTKSASIAASGISRFSPSVG